MSQRRWVMGMMVVLGMGLILPGSASSATAKKYSRKVIKSIGEDAAKIIDKATKVEVLRLEALSASDIKPAAGSGDNVIFGYRVKSKKTKGKDTATRLKKVLLNRNAYSHLETLGKFQPEVAFRIHKGKDSVVVLLSFDTNDMKIGFEGGEKPLEGPIPLRTESRNILVKLTKELLPRDAEIKKLKD